MNTQVKAKWVLALQSGEFEQGSANLRRNDRYCCLGVLCELYRRENPSESNWTAIEGIRLFQTPGQNAESYLPEAVQKWAGLTDRDPVVEAGFRLSRYNDVYGYSFPNIAKLIEDYL